MCKVYGGEILNTTYTCVDGTCSGKDTWDNQSGTTLGDDVKYATAGLRR